ncbi:MAG: sialate O-acetylesterase [Saprospiraceae bacterium]
MKNTCSVLMPLILCFFIAQFSFAQLSLDRIFADNMMLQCEAKIPFLGSANPLDSIKIVIGDKIYNGVSDRSGSWKIVTDSRACGYEGDIIVSVVGDIENQILLSNVIYGDIWLCGGQSNMEWFVEGAMNSKEEIADANYPKLRIFDVPRTLAGTPNEDLDGGKWLNCTPTTIPQFSAVGYFFGRDLMNALNKPIGLIGNNFGGTIVEAWTSGEKISEIPFFKGDVDAMVGIDFEKAKKSGDEKFNKWMSQFYSEDKGIRDSTYLWADKYSDYSSWDTMRLPTVWEDSEDESLHEKDGVVWFSKDFSVAEIDDALLSLGPIDDTDITWINGVEVGQTYNRYNKDRNYNIDKSVFLLGINTIVIRVEDYIGGGGICGTPEKMFLKIGEEKIKLSGDWRYHSGMIVETPMPQSAFGPNNYPSCLFNGMIAPITTFPIKGVIWYQGESNSYRAFEYRSLFPMMIEDWRKQWNQPDLPFLFVQLANFKPQVEHPLKSEWAELREAQAMALALDNTAMITAIDLGEGDNIHPTNKQEVSKRLSNAALNTVYNQAVTYKGPTYKKMKKCRKTIEIKFSDVGKKLIVVDNNDEVFGFSIAGEDKIFHWAKAEIIKNNTVKIYCDKVSKPVAVRYSWQDNPEPANLKNSFGYPAFPFRTDDWEISTYSIKRF